MDSFDSFRMWATAEFPQVSSADAASSSDAAPTLPPIAVPGAVAEAAASAEAEEVQRAEIHFGRLALTMGPSRFASCLVSTMSMA